MAQLVGYLLLFLAVGVGFILIHLVMGMVVRPIKPNPEKMTIYECGEPTIGSAWVQFDLRYYVVALLFVIFDVEVAFFFPWAVVFGQANALRVVDEVGQDKPSAATALARRELLGITPQYRLTDGAFEKLEKAGVSEEAREALTSRKDRLYENQADLEKDLQVALAADDDLKDEWTKHKKTIVSAAQLPEKPFDEKEQAVANEVGSGIGWIALGDILIFFGVLLVGFAYLWKRGDIEWVKSTIAERVGSPPTTSAAA